LRLFAAAEAIRHELGRLTGLLEKTTFERALPVAHRALGEEAAAAA
jgi:hypothetical protein